MKKTELVGQVNRLLDRLSEVSIERDDAARLLAKVVQGGSPTGVERQRINALIRSVR